MKKLIIPIQSFIDVVTNSSTEIFVEATTHTKNHIISMVDEILKAGGSSKTCKDLFEVKLIDPTEEDEWCDDKSYIEVTAKNSEYSEAATYLQTLCDIFDITADYDG